jgi:hypothetical protein
MPFFRKQEPTATDLAVDMDTAQDEEKDFPPTTLDHGAGHFIHDEHHTVDPIMEKRVIRKLDFNVLPLVLVLCKQRIFSIGRFLANSNP